MYYNLNVILYIYKYLNWYIFIKVYKYMSFKVMIKLKFIILIDSFIKEFYIWYL